MNPVRRPPERFQRVFQVLMWLWVIVMFGLYLNSFAGPIGLVVNAVLARAG